MCTLDALSFEHFLPWIQKLMLAYQDEKSVNSEELLPQGASYSKGYFLENVK